MIDDNIQNKLDPLGLYLPKQLQISSNIKTPPRWIRIRGDKALFQVMVHKTLMTLLQDLLER